MHARLDHRPSSHGVKGGCSPENRRPLASPQVPHAVEIPQLSWNSYDEKAAISRRGSEAICYHGDGAAASAKESESRMMQTLRDGAVVSENG